MDKVDSCKRMTVYALGIDAEGTMTFATNYNPTECTNEVGNCGCIHAEIALLKRMPNPVAVFVSLSPCLDCAKALEAAGVQSVYFMKPYRDHAGWDYLVKMAGIICRPITV